MTYEAGKEYLTRNGRRARIYATDGGGTYPIHGAIQNDNLWYTAVWTAIGEISVGNEGPGLSDLMPPEPVKQRGWINIYDPLSPWVAHTLSLTRGGADMASKSDRIACIEVEWYDGQGL